MIEIPQFTGPQMTDIAHIFGQHNITFEYKGATTGVSPHGGSTDYILLVEKDQAALAVDLLMNYFSIIPKSEEISFGGDCPACNTPASGMTECAECGLALQVKVIDQVRGHPFYKFLEKSGIIAE